MVVLLLGAAGMACANVDADGGAAARDETAIQEAVSQEVIADAQDSVARYGQANLGHYLKLKERDLRSYGFQAPAEVSVDVYSSHTSYCIRVTNPALPSIHPWRVATVGSGDGEGSSADQCLK